eukprot:TRINITY_DN2193_c0_g1_i13.p1 TRINITY_DN2193_c0_g1~~TRINITY_DN2193_c0_g1_i13.p1  ORF type:complete len:553 (+),score=107.15 TRINITY_DN2193_c0_g1_i13:157-1815(+)
MLAKLSPFLLLFSFACSQSYEYLNFTQLSSRLISLQKEYPKLIQVETASERYNISSPDCNGTQCPIYIVTLSDLSSYSRSRPEVFISGALHGDEVLGPNIVIYLLEYLLKNYNKDPWVTYLVNKRRLVAMPVPNSQGYFFGRREEVHEGVKYDPNRDFPYDSASSDCLKTLTGKAVANTIAGHIFVVGITFHGGTTVISYPWGSTNHMVNNKGEEAPDDRAMKEVAEVLSKVAGPWPRTYTVGRMTDTVYAVKGGLEDWAYAASWTRAVEKSSSAKTCNKLDKLINRDNVRFPLYLVETADDKRPSTSTLGTRGNLTESQKGHIPRNVRVAMTLMDMAEPYARDVEMRYRDNKYVELRWKVGGALYVNETFVQVGKCKVAYEEGYVWLNDSMFVGDCFRPTYASDKQKGLGYWTDPEYVFSTLIPTEYVLYKTYSLTIVVMADQQWSLQSNPNPKVLPVTHLVNMRITDNYYAESKSKHIRANKYFYTPKFKARNLPGKIGILNMQDFVSAVIGALAMLVSIAVFALLYYWWRSKRPLLQQPEIQSVELSPI